MQHERRMYPRVKRGLRLELHKKRLMLLKGPKNLAELLDVSRSGARINTRTDLKPNDKIVVALKSKTVRGALEFNAQVVWIKPVSTDKGRFLQAGIRFMSVSAEQSSILFRFAVEQIENE